MELNVCLLLGKNMERKQSLRSDNSKNVGKRQTPSACDDK